MRSPKAALFMQILCAASLAACATAPAPEPKIITKTVTIPVPVSCTVAIPAEPAYADTVQALHNAPDILAAVKLLLIGRLQRMNVIDEQKAALSGCSGASK